MSILKTSDLKFGAVSGKEKEYSDALEIDGTAAGIFKSAGEKPHYLFLIPAEDWAADPVKKDGLAENSAAVRFTYDIVTVDPSLAEGYSCTEATKTVYLPGGILKQGKAYNVTFTFNVDQIEVAAEVAGWGDEENGSDVDVPFTPDNSVTGK